MRDQPAQRIEQHRIISGPYGSPPNSNYGAFSKDGMFIIASDGGEEMPWEHVSVSYKDRTPIWDEMCMVKSYFWNDDEAVVQYHPKRGDYVDFHPHCLHLWKPTEDAMPTPPPIAVGPGRKK